MVNFMDWKKAPEELVNFLNEKMKDKNCDYRKMFGYPAYFVNGNLFAGVYRDKLFLRLSDTDFAAFKERFKGAENFEPMPGRPMKHYIVLPKTVYLEDKLFQDLLAKSINYASSLPEKKAPKQKNQ